MYVSELTLTDTVIQLVKAIELIFHIPSYYLKYFNFPKGMMFSHYKGKPRNLQILFFRDFFGSLEFIKHNSSQFSHAQVIYDDRQGQSLTGLLLTTVEQTASQRRKNFKTHKTCLEVSVSALFYAFCWGNAKKEDAVDCRMRGVYN